ncbi:retron Se72 family effector protein [Pseudomonas monteilii]|uniref:retron Se72 family effector protein n=1 Tax=Pseudomonas TaxID=286 RepID=UPI0018E69F2D|nr:MULTISPECIES: retron Se72 family effector protein [Pseudomonas]MBI6917210.1 retron Se72 family effector protein [Pseudomonas monteilii]MCE0937824.1 retron Se72 family effector protein [Pseudomonas kurunegalensis]
MDEVQVDKGVVRTYDTFKGFGFIRREKGRDVFFYYDDVEDQDNGVVVGDLVKFEVRMASKGPRGYKVVRAD